MAIRLWPKDYERKDHITKAEKGLLRYAARNFQSGHIAVGIDPVGLSSETTKMGMYLSPNEGLITYLQFFINNALCRPNMSTARTRWESDLNWVRAYQIN